MAPAQLSEAFLSTIPSWFAGRWRTVLYGELTAHGKRVKDCRRIYYDFYEV